MEVDGLVVEGTAQSRRNVGSGSLFGEIEVGDGIQLLGASTATRLANVTISGAERIGLLVERSMVLPSFDNVRVTVEADAFGALIGTRGDGLALDVAPESGWDSQIERIGSNADATVTGAFDAALTPTPSAPPER